MADAGMILKAERSLDAGGDPEMIYFKKIMWPERSLICEAFVKIPA